MLKYELSGYEKPYDDELNSIFKRISPDLNYSLDDKGISKLFSDIYKDKFKFNASDNRWFYYIGKVWKEDLQNMRILNYAKRFIDTLLIYAIEISDEVRKNKFLKFISKMGQLRFRKTMIEDARDNCSITNGDLDVDKNLFNCTNGTLNLKTYEFKPHDPSDLLSKIANVKYDPDASAPIFSRFIGEIMEGDTDKIEYLQKAMGYALTADTSWETCFIFYGRTTRNGKSTLIETISFMMGNYSLSMQPQTLALKQNRDGRQASGDIARLNGCRFLSVSEFPTRMLLDSALLKKLLGRDTIVARHLYGREFEFVPFFKLFMNTNALPLITDDALFSSGRITVISFDRHFMPEEQDKNLKKKLKSSKERSGILNWCLAGLKRYRIEGEKCPESVRNATISYQLSSDKFSIFLEECVEKSNRNTKLKDVYDTYKAWCNKNEYACESKSAFFNEIKKRNLYTAKARVNNRTEQNVMSGYRIKQDILI